MGLLARYQPPRFQVQRETSVSIEAGTVQSGTTLVDCPYHGLGSEGDHPGR